MVINTENLILTNKFKIFFSENFVKYMNSTLMMGLIMGSFEKFILICWVNHLFYSRIMCNSTSKLYTLFHCFL